MVLGEICSAIRKHRPAATTTIATTLGIMLNKGYVKRRQGPRGYVWTAAVKRQTAAKQAIGKIVDYVFSGSPGQLVAHLIDHGKLNEKEVEQIRRLLKEYKSREAGDHDG